MPTIPQLPNRGAVTDSASIVGASAAGGGRFTAIALRDYIAGSIGTPVGLSNQSPAPLASVAQPGSATAAARADHVHAQPTAAQIGAAVLGHTHAQSDITGLSAALADKAALSHSHAISGVTGLQAALDAKQNTSARGIANGYASLDGAGRVPTAQLPTTLVTTSHLATVEGFLGAYTAVSADNNKVKLSTSATAVTVTLPSLAIGTTIRFIQQGAGKVSFSGSGATVQAVGGLAATAGQYANVTATVVAAGQWNLAGSLGS
jgi:hypothetical protein